jgi:uncharacterized protein involved in type VI secretion and phage assembly
MNLLEITRDEQLEKQKERIYGVVVGIVTNNQDPEKLGRIKVRFPWLSDVNESAWARLSTPLAGKGRGFYYLPEIEDEVLVAFEFGDINRPIIIGSLWNGENIPKGTEEGILTIQNVDHKINIIAAEIHLNPPNQSESS